ncbi:MAG: response regulator transcription factor [Chloroflexota bacterium]|nr:MAG: response regulator transcription factor [Chloroflexota bacterium]
MTTSKAVRVAIADDHPVVLQGLSAMLSLEPGLAVVGEASDGEEALGLLEQTHPDVLLLDLEMPKLHGIEVLRRLKEISPETKVIVLTTFDDDQYVFDAIVAGAMGYLLKGVRREELYRAVRVVAQGGSLMEPSVTGRVLTKFSRMMSQEKGELSDREREVLRMAAQGYRNKEIARALRISERTVKAHMAQVMAKLDVQDRLSAVMKAVQLKLIHV